MWWCYACEPITIYLNNVPDSNQYILTTSLLDPKKIINYQGSLYFDFSVSKFDNGKYLFSYGYNSLYPDLSTFQTQNTLENCFKIITLNFRNVDIIVDGNLWSKGHYDPDDSLIYPIGIPDNFEIYNGVQGGYYYPDPSFWDLQGLVNLIKQAISDYGVVSISDIEPLIIDVNGQPAVRVTNVSRTDYDNLIGEQYFIYPDSEIFQVPIEITDNAEVIRYLATSSGTDLIPEDIVLVLSAGGLLLLIAYLINRMLE